MDQRKHTFRLSNGRDLGHWRAIDRYLFADHGTVRFHDGALELKRGEPATGIVWRGPELPRQDYQLSWQAQRVAGKDFFCGLTFPVGDQYCTWIVGGWGGSVVGLSNIDDEPAVENETAQILDFQNGMWYRLRLAVDGQRIQAWINDERVIELPWRERRLSLWWEQEPARPLGFVTWHAHARYRTIELVRLGAAPAR